MVLDEILRYVAQDIQQNPIEYWFGVAVLVTCELLAYYDRMVVKDFCRCAEEVCLEAKAAQHSYLRPTKK